jgi:anti-sigma regulatory factor (Ser/Thr protein kinase)/GAF domain-containing protein
VNPSDDDQYAHAPCGYLSTRMDGTIVGVNETLLGWLGYERCELIGQVTFQSLLSIGGRIYYDTHYGPLLSMQGAVREIAVDLVRRDGSRMPALVNSDVRVGSDGRPSFIHTAVFSASFRREYEQELLAARRAAEESERRLTLLQELVSEFAVALTHGDVVDALVGTGRRAVHALRSSVWLTSDDGGSLVWMNGGSVPAEPRLLRATLDDPLPHARAAREGTLLVVGSEEELRKESEIAADMMVALGLGTLAVAPMMAGDALFGVVGFGYRTAADIGPEIHQLVWTVARQAGQTLQRTRQFEVEKLLRQRAETLQLITAALAAPLDAQQIANATADRAVATLDFDRVLIVLPGGESAHAVVPAVSTGFAQSTVDKWWHDPEPLMRMLTWPATEGTFMAEASDQLDGLFPDDWAVAVLPLRAGAVVLGTLVLGRVGARPFPPGERSFLRTFATQCAQALERARLHAETLELQREATFLVALSRRLDETAGLRSRAAVLVAELAPAIALRARAELVVESGRVLLAAEPAEPPGAVGTDEFVEVAVRTGTTTMTTHPDTGEYDVAVPLWARGRVNGVLVLGVPPGSEIPRGSRFLSELAASAGLALENGRLYDQEHENAHILQRGLLSGDLPRDPRAAIGTWYRPAADDLEVGGDWHDAFMVGPNRLAIVVGDVVGRGIRAAATMGHLRSAVRALAATDPGPAGLLERLDRFVDRFEDGRMSTVAYGLLDLDTGNLRYACAGHVPPLLIEPHGGERFLWAGRSTPIAAYAGMKPRVEAEVQLRPGARLLLYTDGLVERRTGNLHTDLARLAGEAAGRRHAPLAWLLPDLGAALAETRDDDVCMLCVAFGAGPAFACTVPADIVRLKSVRDELRAWLVASGVPSLDRDAVLLACSEAVANAIEHAYGSDGVGKVHVGATLGDGSVELTVHDRGAWREPDAESDRGRGLPLIETVVDTVTVVHDGGTTITMRRALQGSDAG